MLTSTRTSSSATRAFSLISILAALAVISVLLGEPNSLFTAFNSLTTTLSRTLLSLNISLNFSIFLFKSACSFLSWLTSVLVKRYNCKETIASAWLGVKSYLAIKFFLASFLSLEDLIVLITWSRISND